jgi:hypothetical protein
LPVTCNATVPCGPTATLPAPSPVRVSSNRGYGSDPNMPTTLGPPET